MCEYDCKKLPVTPVFVIKFGGMVDSLADFYSRSFFLRALKSKSSKVVAALAIVSLNLNTFLNLILHFQVSHHQELKQQQRLKTKSKFEFMN